MAMPIMRRLLVVLFLFIGVVCAVEAAGKSGSAIGAISVSVHSQKSQAYARAKRSRTSLARAIHLLPGPVLCRDYVADLRVFLAS